MSKITYGDGFPAYEYGSVKSPAIIVLQEWWGINDIIKGHAEKFAARGYRVLLPDIYKGKIGVEKEEAHHLMSNLDWVEADKAMQQAATYLREGGATKVGAIGFCMGGALALIAAAHADLDAVVPAYGLPRAYPHVKPGDVKIPAFYVFGREDHHVGFSDVATVEAWTEESKAGGGQPTLNIYEEAGHGFLNYGEDGVATRKMMEFYEPPRAVQDKAWADIFEFLDKHLKQ